MSFIETADLADAASFRTRLKVALVTQAATIWGEDSSAMQPARHEKRMALASAVLSSPAELAARFAWPVVANPTVAAAGLATSDSDLQYVAGVLWDALAGVTAAELTPES